jgi:hypothetical protein
MQMTLHLAAMRNHPSRSDLAAMRNQFGSANPAEAHSIKTKYDEIVSSVRLVNSTNNFPMNEHNAKDLLALRPLGCAASLGEQSQLRRDG